MAELNWLDVLRAEVERTSLGRTAAIVGCSKTTLSYVLSGTYDASTERIEARVRGALMNKKVECPVLAEISTNQCLDEQARPFAATNPTRIAVYRACRNGCPHFRRS
jgi:hypothetical protein